MGKIKQVTDPTGVYGFAYDNMGRLTGTTTQYSFLPGYNFQNAYAYDAASNRTWLVAPDGSSNQYSYDALNRLQTLTNSLTGQFGFGYDALSRRTQLTRPNGINTNYGYDAASHLLSVLHQAGNTTLDGASYNYDFAGNRTSKTNYLNGVTEGYSYDLIYQLTQVTQGASTTESYSYDNVGNRLSSLGVPSYSYNSSNELTQNSNGSYTYDANGNTLTDASGKQYSWDFDHRLTQATVPNVGTATFRYDPFGRRIQKSGPLGTTNFLYDGHNAIEELDNSGNILTRYAQASEIDEPLSEVRAQTTSYYERDGINSVTSLSNGAGALANTYIYDTFGNLTASLGSITNPFRYTGREFDPETGIYEYRHRYYDTLAGRFISEDPVQFGGGVNFFAYVLNGPTNFIDPLGLDAVTDDPNFRKCVCQLWKDAGYGNDVTERSAWVMLDSNKVRSCLRWPWSANYANEVWKGRVPPNAEDDVHTHPNSKDPKPSSGCEKCDAENSHKTGLPFYAVSRDGIWKVAPDGTMTHEVYRDIWKTFDFKTCECKQKGGK